MSIKKLGLTIANQLLNQYLRLDEAAYQQLISHHGKAIKIIITNSDIILYLLIEPHKLRFVESYVLEEAVTVSGTASALLKSINSNKSHAATITISGDTELLHTIKQIFANHHIDWEEKLSHYTGDIIAHQVGNQFRNVAKLFGKSKQSLESNIVDYLQEESRDLITQTELDEFQEGVSEIRHDVERLQARINRIKQHPALATSRAEI